MKNHYVSPKAKAIIFEISFCLNISGSMENVHIDNPVTPQWDDEF